MSIKLILAYQGELLKKIDFHIHTVSTVSDASFEYSFETLKRYVEEASLDAIAITNHDFFDGDQYRSIKASLSIPVFAGIEINLEEGHLLLISDDDDLEDFEQKANLISQEITCSTDRINVSQLESIYGDLSQYLLIPHYQKNPPLSTQTIDRLGGHIVAGEVSSPKKFISAIKDETMLTPVLFSDQRMREELTKLPTRQTYIDCGDVTLNAIKQCLRDKRKVALSKSEGNKIFEVFDDGQKISTGLNVLLGERSAGKTHTLERINELPYDVKYIEQFALVQQDEARSEKDFDNDLKTKRSQFIDNYLSGFKQILDDVMAVDLCKNDRDADTYVATLLKSADESDRKDTFSKMALFNETGFTLPTGEQLRQLISSTINLIENVKHRETIERHVSLDSLKNLACELIEKLKEQDIENKKRALVNGLVKDIKRGLNQRTASTQVEDVDLYKNAIDRKKVERFNEIVGFLKSDFVISEENIQAFSVVARKQAFKDVKSVKDTSRTRNSFKSAFAKYDTPYEYLQELLLMEQLPKAEHYRLFVDIDYEVLNSDGNKVSGGQRSEYRLLQAIQDAQNYDILLIDEPESSFDNVFLSSDVNKIIRAISDTMPVVVVTHNSTVGASIGADYILYASRTLGENGSEFTLFSGRPTDANLLSVDGNSIKNHTIMMNSLEAGVDSYMARREHYEAIRN